MPHFSAPLAHSPWIPIGIFLLTYLLIAVESGLGNHLDRTAAAFCGAVGMVLAGAVPLEESYRVIDWNTLIFLLGMMILVAHFQVSGSSIGLLSTWPALRELASSCWLFWCSPRASSRRFS